MNVSDLARQAGIAPSAVRFYERKGILPQAARQDNGYREYTEDDLCRLRIVVGLRRLGVELPESGRLAELCQTGQCDVMARDLLPLVSAQRSAIATARSELDELDRRLAELEGSLLTNDVDPDLCLEKGGDDDAVPVRLRTGMSLPARLPVLTVR